MRHIPEYYVATEEEYRQECLLMRIEPDPREIQKLSELRSSCEEYRATVERAIEDAFNEFIHPHLGTGRIYSRTWK